MIDQREANHCKDGNALARRRVAKYGGFKSWWWQRTFYNICIEEPGTVAGACKLSR